MSAKRVSKLPFPDSLCHRCIHGRPVYGRRSAFIMCENPALPKYVPQPVGECVGHVERPASGKKPAK